MPQVGFTFGLLGPLLMRGGSSNTVVIETAAIGGQLAIAPTAQGALEVQPRILGRMTLDTVVDGAVEITGASH